MYYFKLETIQAFVLYLLPGLLTVVAIGISLGFTHFHGKDSQRRKTEIVETYVGGIEERNAPFPLVLILTIVGTVIWVFAYILVVGILGVKI